MPLGIALVVAIAIAGGVSYYQEREADAAREAREARTAAREARADDELEELRTESLDLMPEIVDGVALGMSVEEVRALRHTAMSRSSDPHDPGLDMYIERLTTGSQVVYLFEQTTQRLEQVQILSVMPQPEAIAPHLTAMTERYGTPTGIWDCPTTGEVPTRRFTWRFAQTSLSDVFLIHAGGISVTLYVTTSARTEASLRRSGCHTVAPEDIGSFPVADHIPTREP